MKYFLLPTIRTLKLSIPGISKTEYPSQHLTFHPSLPTNKGFTLLELIIILVISGILGTMLLPILTSSLTKSSLPIINLKQTVALHKTMENIIADYQQQYNVAWDSGATVNLSTLKTSIGNEGSLQTNNYGTYTVVANRFIQFTSGSEAATANTDLLKVTITDASGFNLTTLFTAQ